MGWATTNNTITENKIQNSGENGISLYESRFNTISRNNIDGNNANGIYQTTYCSNVIFLNNITSNREYGIYNNQWTSNQIYHNNFIDNGNQATNYPGDTSTWDNGFPSGGNYWSDYNGTDNNGDGIGDTPYIIDKNNQDNYPLMELYTIPENPTLPTLPYAPFNLFPEPDSIDVPLDTNISISISRPPAIVNISICPEVEIKERTDEAIGYNGRYTFILSELLEPSTTYNVTIIFGDYAAPEGFAPTSTRTWNFTTMAEATEPKLEQTGIGFPIVEVTLAVLVIVVAFVVLYYTRRNLKLKGMAK